MKQSTCSAVICQPGGHEQKHDINIDLCTSKYHIWVIDVRSKNKIPTILPLTAKQPYW